ncbi:hypothetical protein DPEC_G00264350 [Dallia pectoralis]|uniref:Uncharacterized protein n=1 Tax=Dallia pectoralis TaxID=75939 RepID=A0ACC2FSS7_DALPE|nr:hypothetical protein DPEC_G00264350 [Dallia pectoralis]
MFFSLHFVFLSVFFLDCTPMAVEDCFKSNGVEYRGSQQRSSAGLTCLNWTNISRDYDVLAYTDSHMGVGDHNYCRNPDYSEKPWCYVTGPDAEAQRQTCAISPCKDEAPTEAAQPSPLITAQTENFEPALSGPGKGGSAAVQPVNAISQRVRTGPKKKKDLGTLGYVVGILMMGLIVLLGVGITVGYFYKRARDVKKRHDQRVYEREMQRITLPLSAFSNPTCELVDENAVIIVTAEQTPTQDGVEEQGGDPLIGQQAAFQKKGSRAELQRQNCVLIALVLTDACHHLGVIRMKRVEVDGEIVVRPSAGSGLCMSGMASEKWGM